jgi:hypothetical protein
VLSLVRIRKLLSKKNHPKIVVFHTKKDIMRNNALLIIALFIIQLGYGQNLKPYILGVESTKTIGELKSELKNNLIKNGLQVVGEYQPATKNNRWVMVITSNKLISSVKSIGGLTAFAATLRIGVTVENGKTLITYTNPKYWGNAYFQNDYEKVSATYTSLNNQVELAMKATGSFVGTPFGSEDGLSLKQIRDYHYMMGMPYFDDTVELEDFDSFKEATAKIDASIKNGIPTLNLIYKLHIPGTELTLFGFGLSGVNGEGQFMPIIDGGNPKHTAFLPYEVLIKGDEALILHGRYRIALSFPDLTMGTFSQIMSTPGNIEDLLKQLVK